MGAHSAAHLVQRLPWIYPHGATMYYVTWVMGESTSLQPSLLARRCRNDDRQYVGESVNRPLVQTESLFLDQHRAGNFLLRLLSL